MTIYSIFLLCGFPFVVAAFVFRVLSGKENWRDFLHRFGGGRIEAAPIWIHGASNGELIQGKALILALRDKHPDLDIVVTCNTVTALEMVLEWKVQNLRCQLAPLDYRFILRRFLARVRPQVLVVLENELWPNRIRTFPGAVICVAARMSERSAARWKRFSFLAKPVLPCIDYLSPQDSISGQRFVDLGLPKQALGPVLNLKSQVDLADPEPVQLELLRGFFDRDATILAAS